MHRFYADEGGMADGVARLTPEDGRHALRVLRMKPGEQIELFLAGGRYQAELLALAEDGVTCRVCEALPSTEAKLRITLYQGLPKAEKLEWIIQKAVELGAEAIVPVSMSRCVARVEGKEGEKKRERWQKIAREATKQSGRCRMPRVEAPIPFKQMLAAVAVHEAAIVPWEDAAGYGLVAFHGEHPQAEDVAVVIGPEGGMSEDEVNAMRGAGCRAVTLGPRILRTETAGLAAISALMCLYGEME